MTRWYATRSTVQAPSSDEDAHAQHAQLGPFGTATEARNALAQYFVTGVQCKHEGISTSIAALFVDQYLGLLGAMAWNPLADHFDYDGVRWTIRSV